MVPPAPYGMTSQPFLHRPYDTRHNYHPLSPTAYPAHLASTDSHGYHPPAYDTFYHIPSHYTRHSPTNVSAPRFTPEQQHIHTLFISGLPDDVKAREIHNLFRRRPGFASCQLEYTGRGDQVVAFVTFTDHPSAVAAMLDSAGSVFDPYIGAALHIELARSNSRTKRRRGDGPYIIIDKRAKSEKNKQEAPSSDGNDGTDTDSDKSGSKGTKLVNRSNSATAGKEASQVAEDSKNDEAKTTDIPPCSTVFIANLGPNCTEEELQQVFSQCSGFQTLKMRGRHGMPVAFADFKILGTRVSTKFTVGKLKVFLKAPNIDTESSTEAINNLQGKLLASSDRGGLHLEYARSKMRKA